MEVDARLVDAWLVAVLLLALKMLAVAQLIGVARIIQGSFAAIEGERPRRKLNLVACRIQDEASGPQITSCCVPRSGHLQELSRMCTAQSGFAGLGPFSEMMLRTSHYFVLSQLLT